ncbi:MAG: hypothetical protein ACP5N0_03385 [Methanosarcina sp.]
MHKFMEIVGYILAIIGLACVVKHIMHYKEGCCLCGWHKIKIEDEKPTGTTVSHKIKVEDEKQQGSRYGSNPINY